MRQSRERVKKAAKNAIQKLKNARYTQTDDRKTVNHNDDDLTTMGYYSHTEIEHLSDTETVKMAANNVVQQQAKSIIKKI